MVEKKRAIDLVGRMVRAEVTVMKQLYSTRGVTKKADVEERKAAAILFEELTGTPPTDEEITDMVND